MPDRRRKPVPAESTPARPSYPTLAQEGATRRAFLGAVLGAGAAAGLDWFSVDPAEARGRLRGRRVVARYHYAVPLPRAYRCPRSGALVTGISGRTVTRAQQKLLQAPKTQRKISGIVLRVLRSHRHESLRDSKVRWRVEAAIRTAIRELIGRLTGERPHFLTVSLNWRPPPTS